MTLERVAKTAPLSRAIATMNSNLIDNAPKYNDYLECMVAFIDILGFDSRARSIKSEDDFNKVGRLLFAIKEAEGRYNEEKTFFQNMTVTAVSDSIILTMPYSDPVCAIALIFVLHKMQYELLSTNFETLVRGYISTGPVYHKENIIFGKGYSEAYKKEKVAGHAPRIVIDPVLIEDAKNKVLACNNLDEMDHIFNYIIEDSCDGYFFIDYLKPIGIKIGIPKEQYVSERIKIKKFVEANLRIYKDDEKIIRKYKWLRNYLLSTDHYLK